MWIYLVVIFSIYFVGLLLLIMGWQRVGQSRKVSFAQPFASVVVAVRNETDTLPALLESLARQSYDFTNFEVILIDDHSQDRTAELIAALINQYPHLKIGTQQSNGIGKKQALTTGIEIASGEIILTTDADCQVPANWIKDLIESFNPGTHMVVGCVCIQADKTFFSKLQAMEFTSVIGIGLAMLGWKLPVMCNGASLAFSRQSFCEVNGYQGNFQIPSGDDEFLMRKILNKYPGSITAVNSFDSIVSTQPLTSIHNFFQQRLRWAGKWKVNDSLLAKVLAFFILLVQLAWLLMLLLFLFTGSQLLMIIIGMKLVLEGIFLWKIAQSFKQQFDIRAFLALQILYPIYVISVGVLAQIKSYQWKDRPASFYR
jgi:biofilm PGA synthesis N-glycosyltransferase PgaC